MIGYGERVAVGVSGGKDSLTLLYLLKKILKKNNCNDIMAITIDEGIEAYRDESVNIVKDHCERLNIPFKIFSYKDLFGTSMDEAMVKRPSKKLVPVPFVELLEEGHLILQQNSLMLMFWQLHII